MELSKNIQFCKRVINLLLILTVGQIQDFQVIKDHIIAHLEEIQLLVGPFRMHITNVVYMLELKSQVLMEKLCQDNGNIKLVQLRA